MVLLPFLASSGAVSDAMVGVRLMTVEVMDEISLKLGYFNTHVPHVFTTYPSRHAWSRSGRVTNRFAGPIFRLRRSMRELADGEHVEPVHLRKGDYWQDVADQFNRVIQRVEATAEKHDRSEEEPVEIA